MSMKTQTQTESYNYSVMDDKVVTSTANATVNMDGTFQFNITVNNATAFHSSESLLELKNLLEKVSAIAKSYVSDPEEEETTEPVVELTDGTTA